MEIKQKEKLLENADLVLTARDAFDEMISNTIDDEEVKTLKKVYFDCDDFKEVHSAVLLYYNRCLNLADDGYYRIHHSEVNEPTFVTIVSSDVSD